MLVTEPVDCFWSVYCQFRLHHTLTQCFVRILSCSRVLNNTSSQQLKSSLCLVCVSKSSIRFQPNCLVEGDSAMHFGNMHVCFVDEVESSVVVDMLIMRVASVLNAVTCAMMSCCICARTHLPHYYIALTLSSGVLGIGFSALHSSDVWSRHDIIHISVVQSVITYHHSLWHIIQ